MATADGSGSWSETAGPNIAEIFDDRAERGYDTGGVIVTIDRAQQVRWSRLHRDLPGVNRERKRGRGRFVG